jgi:hypothetical protein
MKPEEIEALDLRPNQRIELVINTSIGLNHEKLEDNENYSKMVYYKEIAKSETGIEVLKYYSATGRTWNAKDPVEGSVLLALIDKIYHLERV